MFTTIDLELQRYVDSIWPAGVRGAMIAMTPAGQVRALYSAPSYDPNVFVGGISRANWRALNEDEARPLLDRAIQTRYPPASPFKLAIGAMALKRGLIGLDTHMPQPCRGGMRLGNRVFRCWKKEGHGSLDLIGAVAASCDVYFYQLGLRLGLNAIIQDGVLMGFQDKSGIDLENEKDPIFPSNTAYFDKLYGPRNWSPPATTLNFSIGQGENTQTLVNMMRFYEGLAGNGDAAAPYIVRPTTGKTRSLGMTPAQLDGLRRALIAVVERGTAAASRRKDLAVAGKTGTAQNPHGKDHGWFIGFAPAEKPELIVGGIMEFAEHGTTVAPYVVRVLHRYLLGPDTAATVKVKLLDEGTALDTAPRPVGARSRLGGGECPGRLGAASGRAVRAPAVDRQLLAVSAGLIIFGLLTLYSAGQTDVPTRAAGRLVPPVLLGRVSGSWGRGSPSTSRRGCWNGSRRRSTASACRCWCWCWWSGPGPAPRRAAIAGSRSAGTRSDSLPSSPRSPPCSCWPATSPAGGSRPASSATCWCPGSSSGRPSSWCSSSPIWAARSSSSGSPSPCCSGPACGRGCSSCSPRRA